MARRAVDVTGSSGSSGGGQSCGMARSQPPAGHTLTSVFQTGYSQ